VVAFAPGEGMPTEAEARGSGVVRHVPALGRNLLFLTVYGEEGATSAPTEPLRFAFRLPGERIEEAEGEESGIVWASVLAPATRGASEATGYVDLVFRPNALEGGVEAPLVLAGESAPRAAASVEEELPRELTLRPVWPNPASREATVRYGVPVGPSRSVRIDLYDVLGRRVTTLVEDDMAEAGWYEVSLDAESLASGAYYVRIKAGRTLRTESVVVVR
jgi:hypothetical protein